MDVVDGLAVAAHPNVAFGAAQMRNAALAANQAVQVHETVGKLVFNHKSPEVILWRLGCVEFKQQLIAKREQLQALLKSAQFAQDWVRHSAAIVDGQRVVGAT